MSIDPPLPLPPSFQAATSPLTFVLNRTKVQLSAQDNVDVTLLEFLRSSGFSGTKLGCGEGGCGSCSVVLGRYSRRNRTEEQVSENPTPYEYKSVNACLLPLIAVHGAHVITVEGIGNSENPHPVQERMAKLFGSQCGYCVSTCINSVLADNCRLHKSEMTEILSFSVSIFRVQLITEHLLGLILTLTLTLFFSPPLFLILSLRFFLPVCLCSFRFLVHYYPFNRLLVS